MWLCLKKLENFYIFYSLLEVAPDVLTLIAFGVEELQGWVIQPGKPARQGAHSGVTPQGASSLISTLNGMTVNNSYASVFTKVAAALYISSYRLCFATWFPSS